MRWKCTCSYDGTRYAGWQVQEGQTSVQEVIERSLETLLKEKISIHGSGRTDAGVHALEQVFHFDFDWRHGGDKLVRALYSKLPKSIRVESAVQVDEVFHARFCTRSKLYHYRLFLGEADPFQSPYVWSVSRKLDLNLVATAMQDLLGKHDFAAFAANRGEEYESTTRTMSKASLSQDGEIVYLAFEADGFMYKMVRSLAGTLVNIGLGRLPPDEIKRLVDCAERSPMVLVAPAQGLFLKKVTY